jgi:hypothetical protein
MEKISNYIKAHPWATGLIVVVGGFIFILLVRGGGGGSAETASTSDRPSDAEIAANATIQAAQISAQAQAAAASAGIQQAQIGAGVQLHSIDKEAEVAMAQLEVNKVLGLDQGVTDRAGITAQRDVALKMYQTQVDQTNAYVSGQVKMNSSNNKQKGLGGVVGLIGGIFSDQRLKENIVYVGQTKQGVNVYEFNYKGSTTRRRGVIAQDLARSNPEMVTRDKESGFLKINRIPNLDTSNDNNVIAGTIELLANPGNKMLAAF